MKTRLRNFLNEHRWLMLLNAGLCLYAYALFAQALPLAQTQWAAWRAWRELERRLQDSPEQQRSATLLQKRKAERQTQIEQFVSHQNQTVQLSHVLHFLSRAAQEHELQILKLTPQASQSFDRHLELPLALELRTHYHGLGAFINTIETAPMIMKITRYQIVAPHMANSVLQVQLGLSVFYLKAQP